MTNVEYYEYMTLIVYGEQDGQEVINLVNEVATKAKVDPSVIWKALANSTEMRNEFKKLAPKVITCLKALRDGKTPS